MLNVILVIKCSYWKILKLFFIFLIYSVPAYTQLSSYHELQAVYIFNFAKYIQWPDEMQETPKFFIGVIGNDDEVEVIVRALKGKMIQGREIKVEEISANKVEKHHIVYISDTYSKHLNALKETSANNSVLIVTEEDLVKKGAAISFIVEDKKLKFKLRESVLHESGLKASEGLLRLAILF